MKEKMLLKLERDRLAQKNEGLQKSLQNIEEKMGRDGSQDGGLPRLSETQKDGAAGLTKSGHTDKAAAANKKTQKSVKINSFPTR